MRRASPTNSRTSSSQRFQIRSGDAEDAQHEHNLRPKSDREGDGPQQRDSERIDDRVRDAARDERNAGGGCQGVAKLQQVNDDRERRVETRFSMAFRCA